MFCYICHFTCPPCELMTGRYNRHSLKSIFNYSKQLINNSLRNIAPDADERKGKGSLGQLVEEYFFGYKVNQSSEQDFASANAELKCTPLRYSAANDEYLVKERLVCGMINYKKDWDKPFELSHFYLKCRIMLILFYIHQPRVPKLDLVFLYSTLWKIPDKDLAIMRRDYDIVISKISSGLAHTLSEGDTMYLGACRKGQKGETPIAQHGSEIKALRRAWSLKTSYMRVVLRETQKSPDGSWCNFDITDSCPSQQLFSEDELRNSSVEEILTNRFAPFIGSTYLEICGKLRIIPTSSKSRLSIIANAIATDSSFSNINRTEEFVKSGLTMKTVRVGRKGRVRESMSFENIDYSEVAQCEEWTDSRLYELFSSKFLFVVFDESEGGHNPILCKVKFWTMGQADLAVAHEYWNNIKRSVAKGAISAKSFWSIRDDRNFHVRPKAKNSRDMAIAADGSVAPKYCYWFNAKYVMNIINNEL